MADYDKTPDAAKWGNCDCCEKPLSEYDWWHSQGHHCQECWNNLAWDEFGYFCQLHEIGNAILVVDGGIPLRVNFTQKHSYASPIVGAVLGLKERDDNITQMAEEITHETLHVALLQTGGKQAYTALDNPQIRAWLNAKKGDLIGDGPQKIA